MGDCPVNLNDVGELISIIQQASISYLGYVGSKSTWSNNRIRGSAIAKRLDIALGSNEWISHSFTKVEHLLRICSDHAPLQFIMNSLMS